MTTSFFTDRFFECNEPILSLNSGQEDALLMFRNKLEKGEYSFEDRPCLCGDNNGKLIARRDRYGLYVDTYLCRACGMLWTSPQMTEESLHKFYEDDYRLIYGGEAKASDGFFEDQVRRGKKIFNFVSDCLEIRTDRAPKIFDYGCGAGGILVPFKEAGCHTFGCDLGSQYLEYGKERGLLLEHGGFSSLTKHGVPDLVLLNHVLEHFKAPDQEMVNLNLLLNHGGYVYIELPGVFNIHSAYGDLLLFLQNAHLYHFTLDTLTFLMSKAGYSLIKGDQSIRAIYQKQDNISCRSTKKEYLRILWYLYLLELSRKFDSMGTFSKLYKLLLSR